jgi:hypothetical protein
MLPNQDPPAQHRHSSSPSRLHQAASSKRYHPYMAPQQHRCRYPDDSVSPSPPPTASDVHVGFAPASAQTDYLSALPQELIEEIGLLTCVPSNTADSSEPFQVERHRLRNLHALSLVSKQFHQIFIHRLYLEPLVIDTQGARSSHLRNSAPLWLNPSCYTKAPLARRFTLWRPWSEEIRSGDLNPVNPFVMLFMLTNIRELTFSGNFANILPKGSNPWIQSTMTSKYVPHLSSVRLIGVDDAELINVFLLGIAPNINTLVIHPSANGAGAPDNYNPRSVYATLRLTLERLTSLESLTVSLPSVKVNQCNHGHKLLQKTLLCLPNKENLKHFDITLPVFDCRSVQWLDVSDSEDEQDVRIVDHAWFWMTLQNFLSTLTNLTTFVFTGSMVPDEIRRKVITASPNTDISFIKAESNRSCRHYLQNIPPFPYNLDVPAQAQAPVQPESSTTPGSSAPLDHPAMDHARRFWPPPDPPLVMYPPILPMDPPPPTDPWYHTSTYEGMPVPFHDDPSRYPLPSLSVFDLLTTPLTSTQYDPEPGPSSPAWQEPSQNHSIDSGFASQEYTVDSGFSSQNSRTEPDPQIWPPTGDWDWYIQYD